MVVNNDQSNQNTMVNKLLQLHVYIKIKRKSIDFGTTEETICLYFVTF
jgi:hypothetical protein